MSELKSHESYVEELDDLKAGHTYRFTGDDERGNYFYLRDSEYASNFYWNDEDDNVLGMTLNPARDRRHRP